MNDDKIISSINPCIVTLTEPESGISEEYRNIKSMIVRLTQREQFNNTIIVTSALSGEGKSVNAANLAITLSQEFDHSVLLVDADLRNPMIHKYLAIENKAGLSDCLLDGIDIGKALVKTDIGKLSVLTAGRSVTNPVELLSSNRMKKLIREMKERYSDRYILIDTPPLMMFAETRAISNEVDGIIFVIREGRVTLHNIEDALSILDKNKILGILYNSVSKENLNGYHKYYYKNYADYRNNRHK